VTGSFIGRCGHGERLSNPYRLTRRFATYRGASPFAQGRGVSGGYRHEERFFALTRPRAFVARSWFDQGADRSTRVFSRFRPVTIRVAEGP
jgi:hypothetical protein